MEAYADRRPAIMTFTGRTGDGGALVTEYEVTESATLQVSRHVVDDDGRTESTQSECTPPPGDWLVGVQGGVALSTDVAFC